MTPLLRRSLIAAALAAPVLALANVAVDASAPAFTATTADGKTVNLADFKGKTVVLEWTNHDCPYVKKHYGSGNMQSQQKDAAAQGVVWLQVISSAPGQQGFVDRIPPEVPDIAPPAQDRLQRRGLHFVKAHRPAPRWPEHPMPLARPLRWSSIDLPKGTNYL